MKGNRRGSKRLPTKGEGPRKSESAGKAKNETLAAALDYAGRGWRVIPCFEIREDGSCACSRNDCESQGKHPRFLSWQSQATTDRPTIKEWWRHWRKANIGIVAGRESNLVVLDIDGEDGRQTLAKLEKELGELPSTFAVATGRPGGQHHYFLHPGGTVKNQVAALGPHLDVRGDGGFVVAPPSRHASGRNYKVLDDRAPAALPAVWVDRLGKKSPTPSPSGAPAVSAAPAPILKGTRNNELVRLAGVMRRGGLDIPAILSALAETNRLQCKPPLLDDEVKRVAESARSWPVGLAAGSGWPAPLSAKAFPGIVGEIIDLIRPHTEADDAGLLLHLIVMFGNAVGRKPYAQADAAKHFANIFGVLVGDSAQGGKGTAANQIRRFMREVDLFWNSKNVVGGLSSGEGLIFHVRDPIYRIEPIKVKGTITGYQDVMTDKGVTDKRLLVLESEFAQPLKVMRREGNILSPILRQAWDSGTLHILTKNSPVTATDAHISIIGHITREELRRSLAALDQTNGFANRFLWVVSKRSKDLPFGGKLTDAQIIPLARRLAEILSDAGKIELLRWGKNAYARWEKIYPGLRAGKPGLVGTIVSRAAPQVLRLALVYALFDRSEIIRARDLEAALEFWRYCEDSTRFIFGTSTGNPVADRILREIKKTFGAATPGLTGTEINDLFGGHRPALEIDAAIDELEQLGKVKREKISTAGRAEERVIPV
jgi:hypothetical protein